MSDEKISLKDLKKQVFSDPAPQREEYVPPSPGDAGYVPPVATVKLPSRGKIYPPESPLFDVQSLDVRAMTATDENIMTSPALLRKGNMLSALIKACVTNRSVDPDDMLPGDRNALMVAIRNASYGARYDVSVRCQGCGHEHETSFDLSRLNLLMLDEEPVELGKNAFRLQLPVTGRTVLFKLFTARESKELDTLLENEAKIAGPNAVEQSVTHELLYRIVSIDGNPDRAQIAKFVRTMPVLDSRELLGHARDIEPDVDMNQEVSCPKCEEKREVEIPLTAEFFWPKTRARGRRRR